MLIKSILPVALIAITSSVFGQTLIEKADKQYELHAYRVAAKSYETILTQNQEQWSAALRLADCYWHLNDLEKAAAQYDKAIRAGHAQAEDNLRYGHVLMMLGRYDAAQEQFKGYVKVDENTANQFISACQYARNNDSKTSEYDVKPLSKINTAAADFGVSMWKDKLIWSSTRSDMKRAASAAQSNDVIYGEANQMFVAPIDGISNQPFKISFLKSDLKNVFNESNPSFSADGKTVVFMRNNIAEDERISSDGGLEMSLFLADIDADGNWRNVRPFPHNSGSTGFPNLSPDGNTLYFASDRVGGRGGFDIYKSEKTGSTWGEPSNLGTTINSQGDEITPFFDGNTLYFSSDWHLGYGGFDVFKVDGAKVVNLGAGFNSPVDDYGFVYSPTASVGFFVSNRKGNKSKDDIYRVEHNTETANIVVLDNGIPIKDATAKVIQGNATNLTALKGGNFLLNLADHKPLSIEIKKEGFKTQTVKIESDGKKSRIVEVNLEHIIPSAMSIYPEYSGMVTDASSGEPIEGVLVRLADQTANTQTEFKSDTKGKFKFPMTANASYLLTFSKEGFIIGQRLLKASDAKMRYLGEFTLTPSALSGGTVEVAPEPTKVPKPITNGTQTIASNNDNGIPIIPSSVKKGNDTKTDKKDDTKKAIPSVYSVQIDVLRTNETLNATKYADLKKQGNVYAVPEGGVKKVRLGVFKTKEEASTAARKITSLGYKGVFVVDEKNEQIAADNLFRTVPQQPVKPNMSIAAPTKKDEIPEPYSAISSKKDVASSKNVAQPKEMPQPYTVALPTKKTVTNDDKTFKVRIAAMKNPKWFDDSKVAKLWKIEKMQDSGLTIFFMDGFKTLEEAKEMQKKVQTSGYKDARVVQRDGTNFKIIE